ncbi:hypothetical protein FGB62_76g076 [Gracilaria domingensis]|nr:hypothetical protein FGB62_76g076 [Gracilaria domingensis]
MTYWVARDGDTKLEADGERKAYGEAVGAGGGRAGYEFLKVGKHASVHTQRNWRNTTKSKTTANAARSRSPRRRGSRARTTGTRARGARQAQCATQRRRIGKRERDGRHVRAGEDGVTSRTARFENAPIGKEGASKRVETGAARAALVIGGRGAARVRTSGGASARRRGANVAQRRPLPLALSPQALSPQPRRAPRAAPRSAASRAPRRPPGRGAPHSGGGETARASRNVTHGCVPGELTARAGGADTVSLRAGAPLQLRRRARN